MFHNEVQGTPDDDFPERMFIYPYRIWDLKRRPIASCAILTDNNPTWRPDSYEVGFGGSFLRSKFLIVKILDYQHRKAELEASNNPFASVILTQLAAIENKHGPTEQRKNVKLMLTKRLFSKGYSREQIQNLYKFIDWAIGLPRKDEIDYIENIHKIEESFNMPYITNAERFGIEKGIEIGMEKGMEKGIILGRDEERLEIAQTMLAARISPNFIAEITKLPFRKILAMQKELEVIS